MRTFSARETIWLQELDGIELAGFRRRAFAFLIDWAIVGIILAATATLATMAYIGIAKATGRPSNIAIDFGHGNIETNLNKLDKLDKPAADCQPTQPATPAPLTTPAADSGSPPPTTTPIPPPPSPTSHNHIKVQRLHPNESVLHEFLGEALHIFADIVVPVLYFGLFLWRSNGRTPGKRLMKVRVVSLVHPHMTFWHSVERALGYGAAALEGGFGFIQFWLHPYRRCAQDRLAETIVVTERSYQATFPKPPTAPDEPTAF